MVNIMKNNHLIGSRTDLISERKEENYLFSKEPITTFKQEENNYSYRTIYFKDIRYKHEIKQSIIKELSFFLNKIPIERNYHAFIVGLGNDNHTADSVGPKTLKHIQINSYLEKLGIPIFSNKISALEPGVLGETGIETKKIIESIVDEIKPNLVILIDSYVSQNIDFLNKTIQITDEGISPGSGLKGISSEISYQTLGIPVIVIGVPTAIEITFNKKRNLQPYLLSTKDIDNYVLQISKIIGESLNEILLPKT